MFGPQLLNHCPNSCCMTPTFASHAVEDPGHASPLFLVQPVVLVVVPRFGRIVPQLDTVWEENLKPGTEKTLRFHGLPITELSVKPRRQLDRQQDKGESRPLPLRTGRCCCPTSEAHTTGGVADSSCSFHDVLRFQSGSVREVADRASICGGGVAGELTSPLRRSPTLRHPTTLPLPTARCAPVRTAQRVSVEEMAEWWGGTVARTRIER